MLERSSVRIPVVGAVLAAATVLSFVPTPLEADTGWMFVVPVAIAAITGGLREGLLTSLLAAVLATAHVATNTTGVEPIVLVSVCASRFSLYGLTAAFLGAFADAHQSVQSDLRRLATLDPLTEVANIKTFYEQLRRIDREGGTFALILVDLDRLKAINDRYGHPTGSAAIQAVANALRRVVRTSDCVARYGGDEFVVVLQRADRPGAKIVVNRLREELAAERLPGAPDLEVTVSVGIALSGEDGAGTEELLAFADQAMYVEKRAHGALIR